MSSTEAWHALESDPDLWHSYVEKLGVRVDTLDFVEMYSLDESCQPDQAIFAFVFLYPAKGLPPSMAPMASTEDKLWTIKQIEELDNCCCLIALLHAIGNNRDKILLEPQSTLAQFFETTATMTPEERAQVLLNNKTIHRVHEDIAEQGQTEMVESEHVDYHYVAYVIFNGSKVYELNGAANGHQARFIGDLNTTTFFSRVTEDVKQKVNDLNGDIRFSLIGLALK